MLVCVWPHTPHSHFLYPLFALPHRPTQQQVFFTPEWQLIAELCRIANHLPSKTEILINHTLLFFLHIEHMVVRTTDHQMMAATIGSDVVLPCSIPDIKSCSSVSWTKSSEMPFQVVIAGNVNPPTNHKLSLRSDCSLRISQVANDDARTYICSNGVQNANVSLYIVERKWNSLGPFVCNRALEKVMTVLYCFYFINFCFLCFLIHQLTLGMLLRTMWWSFSVF